MGKPKKGSARMRVREQQRQELLRAQRRKTVAIVLGATLFLVLAVAGGYWYMSSSVEASHYEGELAPQAVHEDGSVVMARPDTQAPVVEVYSDFQCPVCAEFEEINAGTLYEMAAEGEAVVHLRPVSIFAVQPSPLSDNSLRAAAAARAAADYGVYAQYSDLLWQAQPSENQEGYAIEQLEEFGAQAGIADSDHEEFTARLDAESAAVEEFTEHLPGLASAAQEALSDEELASLSVGDLLAWGEEHGAEPPDLDGTYVQQILDATTAAGDRYPQGADAFTGTPAVYVNGTQLDLASEAMTVDGLREAVAAAGPGEVDTAPADHGPDSDG